jgi:outer membrane protein insertion porin family
VLYYHLIFVLKETHLAGTASLLTQSYRNGNIIQISRQVLVIFFLVLFVSSPAQSQTGPLIKLIEVNGNKKISTNTILSKLSGREGDSFSKNSVQDDIKSLYKIGYFDDVSVDIEPYEGGVKLIYNLVEKPSITSIDFQGNDEFETDKLKEQITLTLGAIANLPLIADNAKSLISFYQSEGYWLAKVIPIIREISADAVALTYQVDEGPKVKVKKVTIEGNNALSDRKIKKVMQTKKWWLFSFLTGSGIYKRDQMKDDVERIRDLYHSIGYIYVVISEPKIELSPDRKKLYIAMTVSERDQYSVGDITVQGNAAFSESDLLKDLEIASGQIFNRRALRKDVDNIIDHYMENGYARVDVNPLINVRKQEHIADITLSITEGGIFRIGRINITGNTKTRDKVIRREMRLDEGEIFNKKMIRRSYQRINNLNFFEGVDVAPVPRTDAQLVDINIDVKEKLTGMLSIGGGYSSIDKFMVMGEITQTNLFGKGLYLKFRADLSARRTNYKISLRDPWFLDKPVSATFSVYNEEVDYLDYDKKATGGSIGFGKELTEYVGGNITYNIEEAEITNIQSDASDIILDQEGIKLTSSISPSIWRDSRNNYLDPTEGSKNALYTTLAGLGGDNYYWKAVADSLWYVPAPLNTTFSFRARAGYAAGYAGETLPLYERFYVGGINTVRGLGFGEGGPRDDEGEVIGGNWELIFNNELIFPLIEDIRLKGLVFFDYGGAFDEDKSFDFSEDMRNTVGFGVRWLSPLGPIRLEWGFNIDSKPDENDNKLEFSMGGVF